MYDKTALDSDNEGFANFTDHDLRDDFAGRDLRDPGGGHDERRPLRRRLLHRAQLLPLDGESVGSFHFWGVHQYMTSAQMGEGGGAQRINTVENGYCDYPGTEAK